MAYADANTTNRKLGAGTAVLLLEAGLAWAVVTGLATSFTRTEEKPFVSITPTKEREIKPIEPPKPQDQTPSQAQRSPQEPRTDLIFDTGPAPMPTTVADGGLGDGGIGELEITRPAPPTPPPPRFTPKSARPRGGTGNWVSDNDYPTGDLRAGHEGRTSYRLAIDASGKVTDCTVTTSSGWSGLDRATCDRISSRARFDPATNSDGDRVAGTFSGAVTWRIPSEE